MNARFRIPRVLQSLCQGRGELELQGSTVRCLINELHRSHPSLYRCICDESGSVRRHINLFVNDDFIQDRNGLDTQLSEGDVVSVFQAVSGG